MATVAQLPSNPGPNNGPILLTIKQVADLTGLSTKTIRRHWKRRRFPAPIGIGGAHRWRYREIFDWINGQDAIEP